jgi:hypothetical protein
MITHQPLGAHSVVEITLESFGPTRTNRLDVAIWLGLSDSQLREDASVPTTVLATGDWVTARFPPLGEWLPASVFPAIMENRTRLVYSGTISYMDVFGNRHTVDCAGTYHTAQNAFSIDRNEST